MEIRATDQSHLNIEAVSNVYFLRQKLSKNESERDWMCANKQNQT